MSVDVPTEARVVSDDGIAIADEPRVVAPATAPTPTSGESAAPPRRASASPSVAKLLRRSLLVFAIAVVAFVVFLVLFSRLEHGRTQTGLERRFRQELATAQAPIGGDIADGAPVALLQVKPLGLREVVVQGTDSATLRRGPGHVAASPLPGQPGHSVLVGRRLAYGGPFANLGRLRAGDTITVTTGQGVAKYTVTTVRHYAANDGSFLTAARASTLSLVTSDPVLFPSRRLVVNARLQSAPFASTDYSAKLGSNDFGLDGDAGGFFTLVIWLEVMLVAAVATVWLSRRWNAATAYPICIAVLLAVAWCVFDSAAVVFPATL